MGVTGLWRLLEPAGKPVPLETLDGKILAVDISIWLHQMIKGFQDAQGAPLPNAHLLGLFQRLCKLLYYRIKPIFVFDGGVPALKKHTIAKRQMNKAKLKNSSDKLRSQLISLLGNHSAINLLLSNKTSPKKSSPKKLGTLINDDDTLFKLPPMEPDPECNKSDSEEASSTEESDLSKTSSMDLHTANFDSDAFKALPLREKYDLLTELKETRKQNSWGKLHELPSESDNFSGYQMERLLKRRKLQVCIEETEKEMGGDFLSLNEMEKLLNEEGISTSLEDFSNRRVASDENTRYLYINDVKQAMIKAKSRDIEKNKEIKNDNCSSENIIIQNDNVSVIGDEVDEDLQEAIKLSLRDASDETDHVIEEKFIISDESLSDSQHSDTESNQMTLAKAYMLENTDLTTREIDKLLNRNENIKRNKRKTHTDSKKSNMVNEDKNSIDRNKGFKKSENPPTIERQCNVNVKDSAILEENESELVIPNLDNAKLTEIILTDNSDESSENEEFEEVQDQSTSKVGIPLDLNYDHNMISVQDDIFADIFEDSKKINQNIENLAEKNEAIKTNSICDDLDLKTDIHIIKERKLNVSTEETKADDTCIVKHFTETIDKVFLPVAEVTETEPKIIQAMDDGIEDINNDFKVMKERSDSESIPISDTLIDHISSDTSTTQATKGNEPNVSSKSQNVEDLKIIASEIEKKHEELMKDYGKFDRMSRNISEEMTKDAQELLSIFGIPYIVSPMEAEAQCAFLELTDMSQGTITDDSDIWLFGGHTVYKNFFDQRKHVLQFLSQNIEKLFNLSRENLILLALLVGSDYTVGLSGVGPVTALEILAEFPSCGTGTSSSLPNSNVLGGLMEFKKWLRTRRSGSTNLRNKLKNVTVTDDFPSISVVQAYLSPEVNTSKDKFTWGMPDVTTLREFAKNKFGWSQTKTDEILNPVLKRLDVKFSQRSIQSFFKTNLQTLTETDERLSKRVKSAIGRLGKKGNEESIESEYFIEKKKKKSAPSKAANKKPKIKETEDLNCEHDDKEKRDEKGIELLHPHENSILDIQTVPQDVTTKNDVVAKGKRGKRKLILPSSSGLNKIELEKEIFKKLHKKDLIPQREKDNEALLKNKLKAIEVFRKTKLGPNRLKLKKRTTVAPKEDAGLSESSDSN